MTYPGQGERAVTVIVDGNNHNIVSPTTGKPVVIQTIITDNIVTLAKCREITKKIIDVGHTPKYLRFILSIYDNTDDIDMDVPPTCLLNKSATYNVKHDELIIYDNGEAVYANTGGIICRDKAAIADCMGDC
jgi:hypothetical protein